MRRPSTTELLDQPPPHDLDAEKALLAAVIVNPDILDQVDLNPADLHRDAHRRLLRVCRELAERGGKLDALTVRTALVDRGELEAVGGDAGLGEIMQGCPVWQHWPHYQQVIRLHAQRRRFIGIAEDLIRSAHDKGLDVADVLAQVEAGLAAVGPAERIGEPVTAAVAAVQAQERIETIRAHAERAGVMTGLPYLDERLGGLFAGELFVLAARPGVGKTSLACQIAHHVASRGPVYFCSLEMSAAELATRIACGIGRVSNHAVRTGRVSDDDCRELARAFNEFGATQLWIHDRASLSAPDIRRAARRLAKSGLRLVVVDYLQRVCPTDWRLPRHEQVAETSDALKGLARELNVPVLCLAQLNRETEKTPGGPKLCHLKDSGSIEQDADVVAFLIRETEGSAEQENTAAELRIEKNRNGRTGLFNLTWHPERTLFSDASAAAPWSEFSQYG
jgi:replicative DNA helicase